MAWSLWKSLAAAATALAVAATPVGAQCWSPDDAALAKARALQTRLMLASMRCGVAGVAIGGPAGGDHYGAFMTANRGALAAVNQRLRARFWTAFGREEGQRQLDAFTGALVDQQSRQTAAAACASDAALAHEATTMAGSVTGLIAIAERSGVGVRLPGGLCPVAPAGQLAAVRIVAR